VGSTRRYVDDCHVSPGVVRIRLNANFEPVADIDASCA
jgi:hypothetical protein